ncbi:MAG: indole-3-glycerol phosphate synthase TrpC [Bacillus sp. (in: Bacteria)]|nr:indole-3-glycerol phosphate synthase TrpC [Bacillus sp. (in: firmicutes)]
MRTILERIIEQKKKEVRFFRERNQYLPVTDTQKRSFIHKLQTVDELAIIAEFKRASPSKGVINDTVEPGAQAQLYEKYGAAAVSVLTDQTFFQGSFADLQAVRAAVELPILCKDFMIDPLQIDLAAAHGADIILLIVAALDEDRLGTLYRYAKSIDLEVLVEVHNQAELEKALKTGAKIIGVNNRDLKTFQVSLDVTERLAQTVKSAGAYLISESGILQRKDVERVRKAGVNGILVGEAFMKNPNVKQSFLDFRMPFVEEAKG